MTVGEKIRNLRRFRGWSQETLGKMVGAHQRTICGWELSSTYNMPIGKFFDICKALDISPIEMLKGVEL